MEISDVSSQGVQFLPRHRSAFLLLERPGPPPTTFIALGHLRLRPSRHRPSTVAMLMPVSIPIRHSVSSVHCANQRPVPASSAAAAVTVNVSTHLCGAHLRLKQGTHRAKLSFDKSRLHSLRHFHCFVFQSSSPSPMRTSTPVPASSTTQTGWARG